MKIQSGNAVLIYSTFRDWTAALTDPESVQTTIFDSAWEPVLVKLGADMAHPSVGRYQWFWIASDVGIFFIEWSAVLSGLPSVRRDPVEVVRV